MYQAVETNSGWLFYGKSFIGIQVMYKIIYPLRVHDSKFFGMFTDLCNHWPQSILESGLLFCFVF